MGTAVFNYLVFERVSLKYISGTDEERHTNLYDRFIFSAQFLGCSCYVATMNRLANEASYLNSKLPLSYE